MPFEPLNEIAQNNRTDDEERVQNLTEKPRRDDANGEADLESHSGLTRRKSIGHESGNAEGGDNKTYQVRYCHFYNRSV